VGQAKWRCKGRGEGLGKEGGGCGERRGSWESVGGGGGGGQEASGDVGEKEGTEKEEGKRQGEEGGGKKREVGEKEESYCEV